MERTTPTARQQDIIEKTLELVQESGLANLTLKRVAERVGFTEAAIYRHFPNKRALIFGLISFLGERLLSGLGSLADDRSKPPAERIERMVRHHVSILQSTNGLPILLVAEGLSTGDQELITRLGQVMERYRNFLSGALGEMNLDLPVSPNLYSILFLGLPVALAIQLRAHPERDVSKRDMDTLVRHYVRALTAPANPDDSQEEPR